MNRRKGEGLQNDLLIPEERGGVVLKGPCIANFYSNHLIMCKFIIKFIILLISKFLSGHFD